MTASGVPFLRDRFTWLAYLMLAYYAYMQSALGPLMPFLAAELNMSYTVRGLHLSAFALGMIISGATADRLAHRLGRKRVFWLGGAGMAAGGLALVSLHTPPLTIAASLLMGTVGSFLLVMVQAGLSDHHGPQRSIALTESNVCASLASMLAPLVISQAEGLALGWRVVMLLGAAAWLVMAITGYGVRIPPEPPRPADRPGTARLPRLFWIYWGVVFLAVSVEWSVVFWSPDFLERVVGLDRVTAAGGLTFFYLAAVIGRFFGSRLTRRVRPTRLLVGAALIVVLAFPVFLLARTSALALGALFAIGLGVANLFPLTLSAATTAGAAAANKASARTSLAAGLAILIAPQVLGSLADRIGMATAFALTGALPLGVLGLVIFANLAQNRRDQARAKSLI